MGYEVINLNNDRKVYLTNKQAETMLSNEIKEGVEDDIINNI